MMTNICYGESMSQPRNNKNFEFDSSKREQRMSEIVTYAKTEFFRKPNVPNSEVRKFRSVD